MGKDIGGTPKAVASPMETNDGQKADVGLQLLSRWDAVITRSLSRLMPVFRLCLGYQSELIPTVFSSF